MSEPTAAQLKDEGNELFKKQDYVGAIVKYTEAIALDDKNAVLYANRAACNHALNRYLDAVDDAHMATELDPGYAKGWSRLAASRDVSPFILPISPISPWTHILGACGLAKKRPCLAEGPRRTTKTKLSPAERQQQDQYTAGLRAVNARLNAPPIVPLSVNEKAGKFPWQVATDMLPALRRAKNERISSSAWVVALAYEEFNNGVEMMKGMKKVPHPSTPDGFMYHGNLDGLVSLSNGLMRDDRVFHINCNNWISMYNEQVMFEITARKAWDHEGLETVKELAQKRLKENGWDDVRPAMSVTVRAWIMRAAFEGGLRQEPQAGVEYYRRALDLVEWGRTIWKDVPKASRGAIFERSFLIGIRSLYLKMLMSAYTTDPGLNSKFPLEQLKEEAEDLLKETEIAKQIRDGEPVDPGFISSFLVYPEGLGHAFVLFPPHICGPLFINTLLCRILGFYHVQSARYSSNPVERMYSFVSGAGEYTTASGKYPEDDELRAWYLNCTLDCLRNAGMPVNNFLMVAFALRETVPKMKKIWAISELALGGIDQKIQANLDKADELTKRVADKTLALEDPVPL
ncbi:hypothetical protein DEU56DRAFT_983975 [Suillus clintonianus]|uniref:uncharacterized protein n=1 Tax=Suillus clintonianus TaxID=1904413 RepID=UPI001B87C3DE|nr:uncharacterized protein DEU56DRAFT_983975 [Suillus clintonianus]KAG2122778.1 hypothetical protein DEU56DRAFT_983975 [Suillus clintonianus]